MNMVVGSTNDLKPANFILVSLIVPQPNLNNDGNVFFLYAGIPAGMLQS